ncbi:hypothetical protein HMPREF1863_01408 [Aedoeadaptatus coxii]|uniref:Uncharacterized protein n=1 Tax=Aedoeadaptatus coxii TaxID=755172 RepID=A0A134AC70_9FIRM|nr:hypothetical protein HMPREF1863_01408 [Peptoniphilus coxii]
MPPNPLNKGKGLLKIQIQIILEREIIMKSIPCVDSVDVTIDNGKIKFR